MLKQINLNNLQVGCSYLELDDDGPNYLLTITGMEGSKYIIQEYVAFIDGYSCSTNTWEPYQLSTYSYYLLPRPYMSSVEVKEEFPEYFL